MLAKRRRGSAERVVDRVQRFCGVERRIRKGVCATTRRQRGAVVAKNDMSVVVYGRCERGTALDVNDRRNVLRGDDHKKMGSLTSNIVLWQFVSSYCQVRPASINSSTASKLHSVIQVLAL